MNTNELWEYECNVCKRKFIIGCNDNCSINQCPVCGDYNISEIKLYKNYNKEIKKKLVELNELAREVSIEQECKLFSLLYKFRTKKEDPDEYEENEKLLATQGYCCARCEKPLMYTTYSCNRFKFKKKKGI